MVGENLAPADTLSGHVGIAHPREFSWHEPATAAPIRIEPWRVKEWRYRGERMRRWSPSMATPTVGHLQPCCSCHWPLAPAPCTTRTSSSIPATRATPPFDRSCHSSAYAASPSTLLLCPTLPRCLPPLATRATLRLTPTRHPNGRSSSSRQWTYKRERLKEKGEEVFLGWGS